MSIYATNDEIHEQIASNKGWRDVCRYAEEQGGPLAELCETGIFEPAKELYSQIRMLRAPDDPTVTATLRGLQVFIRKMHADDPVLITDGMSNTQQTTQEQALSPMQKKILESWAGYP